MTRLVLVAPLDFDQATSLSVEVTVTDGNGDTYAETFIIDVQERSRITIDASSLNGVDFATYLEGYFAQVALNGSSAYHGGTPDGMFGYLNGDQVTFRYRDAGEVSPEPFTHVGAGGDATPSGVLATASGHGQFLFNEDTNQLWWDADGTGKAAAVLLATFQNGAHVTATDFDLL